MTENERVRCIRKDLGYTMEEFGKRVGVTKNAISMIEAGKNALSSQMATAICREFGISEVWLRSGEGDPVPHQARADQLAAALGRVLRRQDSASSRLIGSIAMTLEKLDDSQIAAVLQSMTEIIESYNTE